MASQDRAAATANADGGKWDQYGPSYDQTPFSGHARTYVIASMPRSGSHMLGHLLFGTGQLGSPLEYIHPHHLAKWQSLLGEESPAATLRAIIARRTSPSGWFGVKAHWSQLSAAINDPELLDILDPQDWIRITRNDRIAQATSLVIAQQTKSWISFHTAKKEPTYDFDAIARSVRALERQEVAWDNYFTAQGIAPHVVVYEEMLADPARTVADVCTRLGVPVPASPPEPGTSQQATAVNQEWRERFIAESSRR